MKLVIQIPCLNEEHHLAATVADLPKSIPGIDKIEIQVIDDGSADKTSEVARQLGVDHVVTLKKHRGLATAFRTGVQNAILIGADILVNTDADNQYVGEDIVKLVQPVMDHKADVVIGCRPIDTHPDFSRAKKIMQKLGSWVLRALSASEIRDAPSGFRAYNRDALLHLNVFSNFSYTLETIIQASHQGLKIESVDVRVNPRRRKSRLFKNTFHYLWRSGSTILSVLMLYRAKNMFNAAALLSFSVGCTLSIRYVILISKDPLLLNLFWPTVILSGALLTLAILFYVAGFLSKLISVNRVLMEETLYHLRRMELDKKRDL